jgi:asparagine synthase (glutamine-hydrolysing)
MRQRFRTFPSFLQSHGARWLFFRVGYALRLRTGFIRLQMPAYEWQDRPLESWLKKNIPSSSEEYARWRKANSPAFFFEPSRPAKSPQGERSDERSSRHVVEGHLGDNISWNPQLAVDEAERVLNGEIEYFSHRFLRTGFPPDWHADPDSGIRLDSNKHWSEISHDGEVDIKFIWEANRCSMVYTLVRAYAFSRDERFAEAFWGLVQSWAESNPPNRGPNWMDGQEIALRLMAWTFGYYAFIESPSNTPERVAQFTVWVAAQAERIHRNIGYAISTQSNHTISEAFGLWLVGLLFPELKDSTKYFRLGRDILEAEAPAQILADGTYSMYSLNYHRFVLHIYLYALRLGELNHSPLSDLIRQRVESSIDYLYQLVNPKTGQMPVYGSNDGALVLPLNNCDFTDYRPLLQLGSYFTRRKFLSEPGPWDEDTFWFYGMRSFSHTQSDAVRVGRQSAFPQGGTYILRGADSQAIIRCTDHKTRPSHADQLHVDLWWHGHNIACDAGTYLYSGQGIWRNGLARTSVHNTVTVDQQDQMKMVSRFTWTDWSRGKVLQQGANTWQGEHDGYRRLSDSVTHKRTVLSLADDRWLVMDHLIASQSHHYALQWLLNDFPYEQKGTSLFLSIDSMKCKIQTGVLSGEFNFSVLRADENSTRGWRSRYYGHKEPAISMMLETDQSQALFWTFFGSETDSIQLINETLKISSPTWETSINLKNPISGPQTPITIY